MTTASGLMFLIFFNTVNPFGPSLNS